MVRAQVGLHVALGGTIDDPAIVEALSTAITHCAVRLDCLVVATIGRREREICDGGAEEEKRVAAPKTKKPVWSCWLSLMISCLSRIAVVEQN